MRACGKGFMEIVKILIQGGAKVNLTSKVCATLLLVYVLVGIINFYLSLKRMKI